MEEEMEKKEKKERKEKAEPAEEERKPEFPEPPKPRPEYIPPKVEPRLPEEKPVVKVVKPRSEFVAPSTSRAMMSRNAERIFSYLKEHGLASPLHIAKDLNIAPLTVMKALRELEKHDKILLQVWKGGEFKERRRTIQR